MAVVAPMPNASVMTAVVVNPGVFFNRRSAACRSAICVLKLSLQVIPLSHTRGLPSQIRMNRLAVSKIIPVLVNCNTWGFGFWFPTFARRFNESQSGYATGDQEDPQGPQTF